MAYTLQDIRNRVRTKIKDSAYSANDIDGFINDAQQEIADLYTWKYFEKSVAGALTVGEYTFELQDDHQITQRLILIHPTQANTYINITDNYMESDMFFDRYPAPDTLDNAQPYSWTEYGDQVYFSAPVDLAYSLRTYYLKTPTELTADSDVPELPRNFREALVYGAAYRVEQERDNYDIASVLEQKFGDRVSDLMNKHSNTTLTGPDTVILPRRGVISDWDK